ncbi:restriction endonuclease subunit S [Myxococcota bacterium]|nr:restriction endonuclease subunit S [Myxococcota bacterium]
MNVENGVAAWASSLPPGWAVLPLKHIARVWNSNVDKKTYPGGIPVRLCNYTDVYYNDFIRADMTLMEATATPDEVVRFSLCKGDVIITKDSETPDDIAVPAVVADDLQGVVCGYHLTMLRPRPLIEGRFLFRALQASGVRVQFHSTATGITRFGLGQDDIRNAVIPLPPTNVQIAIANFLDEKTAAIDDLIAQKQRLIDLLQEKRTALINRAVTKGLDRTVTMKDSGIPWIGEIPAHWRVLQLRRLILAVEQGWSPDCDSRPADGDEWGVLKSGCTNHGTFNPEENKALPGSMAADPRLEVRHGDVLMSRASGSAAHVGSIAQVLDPPPHLIFSDKTFRITFDLKAVWPSFAVKALGSAAARTQIERAISGAGGLANNLPQSELVEIVVPLPPVNEQRELAGVLEEASRSINGLVKDSEAQIARLQEYRQALITAAVTGKLDVAQETVR